jgi:predicted nucleic acid-binding protein
MVVLIDTNIILDFLEDREPFHKAAELLRRFQNCNFEIATYKKVQEPVSKVRVSRTVN